MMELILDGGLLTFDGQVVEFFRENGASDRYHVRFITRLELESERKGVTLINLRHGKGGGFSGWVVPASQKLQAEAFIEAVMEEKGKFSASIT